MPDISDRSVQKLGSPQNLANGRKHFYTANNPLLQNTVTKGPMTCLAVASRSLEKS